MAEKKRKLALVASKGTLDWAYPPFILASTAAAMGWEVGIFFTFYGLNLLKKDMNSKIDPASNPAMPMKLPFGPEAVKNFDLPIPNLIAGNLPGFQTVATSLMKKTFKDKGVATIEELREMCIDAGVHMISCQMTQEVFGFKDEEFIDGIEHGGAATFLEFASDAEVSLFV